LYGKPAQEVYNKSGIFTKQNQNIIMIQFNDLTPKSLLQDLTDKKSNEILGGASAETTVQDPNKMTAAMGAITSAQIGSSVSLSMQTAFRQIARQFGDGISQTAR
jgi:hypothetical protein